MNRFTAWASPGLFAALVVAVAGPPLLAQGPSVAYYYQPGLALPWAACSVSMGGGSRLPLPFLPVVVDGAHAPVGTAGYTLDVAVDAPMVFVGDGVVREGWDAYRHTWAGDGEPLDVAGKAVVLCYDCRPPAPGGGPQASEEPPPLAERLAVAARRGAAAVVAFSVGRDAPFLVLAPDGVPDPEIPVISLSRPGAVSLFEAAGAGGEKLLDELASAAEPPPSRELITRLQLRIEGAFERVETRHFAFSFRGSVISRRDVESVAAVHEKCLVAIEAALGRAGDPPLPAAHVVYFTGFDAKTFYTHHWGSGLASGGGVFLIWPGPEVDPGLIAHEHTHTFVGNAWGASSSFLGEGVARYMEARVTDPAKNRTETLRYLDEGKLPPLAAMLPIDVGSDELTPMAYPAAGAFVEYLLDTYGLGVLRSVYELEGRSLEEKRARDTWESVLGEPLERVDREWRRWLRAAETGGRLEPRTGTSPP